MEFTEWETLADAYKVQEIIKELTGAILDQRNAWALPFLCKQLEAFQLLSEIPLRK